MKPIVFDTVIDGVKYEFHTKLINNGGYGWYAWTNIYDDSKYDCVFSEKSEEDAILQLVKKLEK